MDSEYKWMILVFLIIILVCLLIGLGMRRCGREGFGDRGKYELGGEVAKSAIGLKADENVLKRAVNPNVNHMIATKMFDSITGQDELLKRTDDFHRAFERNREERMGVLKRLYSELGSPREVTILYYCKNFFVFFDNWVRSCERAGIETKKNTICFALDKEAYDNTVDMGYKCYLIDPLKYEEGGGSNNFGDRNYAATMFYKNAIIYDMLQTIPQGNFLLFQDSDLIWFKDPFMYLRKEEGEYDIQMMYDGGNTNCKYLYANTGFIYIKNNERTRSLFETALNNSAYIFKIRGHQVIFDQILHHFVMHNVLSLRILPETEIVNGHLVTKEGVVNSRLGKDWMSTAVCFHYSWTGDKKEKFKKLAKLNLNFVDSTK